MGKTRWETTGSFLLCIYLVAPDRPFLEIRPAPSLSFAGDISARCPRFRGSRQQGPLIANPSWPRRWPGGRLAGHSVSPLRPGSGPGRMCRDAGQGKCFKLRDWCARRRKSPDGASARGRRIGRRVGFPHGRLGAPVFTIRRRESPSGRGRGRQSPRADLPARSALRAPS